MKNAYRRMSREALVGLDNELRKMIEDLVQEQIDIRTVLATRDAKKLLEVEDHHA